MIFISLTVRDLRGLPDQLNPETEIAISCGPASLRDEYFRLLGVQSVQSRSILERLNNARAH